MWWCALKDTWGVSFLFLLYVVSLFAFHYMLTFRTMCISSLEGGFRKIYFLFMYCISVLCLYLFFYFCLVIFYSICFSVSICCFYFVVAFYFLFCCTCFTIFTYMNIKNTDFTTAIFLCFVEFRHFLIPLFSGQHILHVRPPHLPHRPPDPSVIEFCWRWEQVHWGLGLLGRRKGNVTIKVLSWQW